MVEHFAQRGQRRGPKRKKQGRELNNKLKLLQRKRQREKFNKKKQRQRLKLKYKQKLKLKQNWRPRLKN